MTYSRRSFLGIAGATAATLSFPGAAKAAPAGRWPKPIYSLTGGASTDGILVNSILSPSDAYQYCDLAVSPVPNMSGYTLVGVQRADEDAIVRHLVTGKSPDTPYYAMLYSDGVFLGEPLKFRTLPLPGSSWSRKIAVVSCMGNAANHFSTELAWSDVQGWQPDEIWHLGDWGYWGQQIGPHDSYKKDLYHYLRSMRHFNVMRRTIQAADLNVVTISDHELTIGGDPPNGIHNSPQSIRELIAFQKLFPIRTYGDTRNPRRGRYYSYDIGNAVRVIVTDFRTPDRSDEKDPDGPNKKMFGDVQMNWLLAQFDSSRLNLLVNETSWLARPDQHGRAKDKPWYYFYDQQKIANYITDGGYKVAWIGGDRHYVGYLAGSEGSPHNTLGGFPCYISSGMAKESLNLQEGEFMTWQFGANRPRSQQHVCGYMRLTLSYNASTHDVSMSGLGRAVLDTSPHVAEWVMSDIPGGTAFDTWRL